VPASDRAVGVAALRTMMRNPRALGVVVTTAMARVVSAAMARIVTVAVVAIIPPAAPIIASAASIIAPAMAAQHRSGDRAGYIAPLRAGWRRFGAKGENQGEQRHKGRPRRAFPPPRRKAAARANLWEFAISHRARTPQIAVYRIKY